MNVRLPQNYIPTHYDLFIHYLKDDHPFDANVTITFEKNQDDDKVVLNVERNISIQRITQNAVQLKYEVNYPSHRIQLKSIIKFDQFKMIMKDFIRMKIAILHNLKRIMHEQCYHVLMIQVFEHHLQSESKYQQPKPAYQICQSKPQK